MNKVFLSGRLTRDVELKQGNGNAVFARANIAVDRRNAKKEVDFFNLVAFGKTAEFLNKYFSKGSKLIVEGQLRLSTYEDKAGTKKYSIDVIVDSLEFADSKKKAASDNSFDGEPVEEMDMPF